MLFWSLMGCLFLFYLLARTEAGKWGKQEQEKAKAESAKIMAGGTFLCLVVFLILGVISFFIPDNQPAPEVQIHIIKDTAE